MGLFGVDIAAEIASGFDGLLLSGTLTKVTGTTINPANGDPINTTTDYPVQGIVDAYSDFTRLSAGIPNTYSKLVLIADLCGAEPVVGDKVQLGGKTWKVLNVAIDPASASYVCQADSVQP